jgi:hypothetical protein
LDIPAADFNLQAIRSAGMDDEMESYLGKVGDRKLSDGSGASQEEGPLIDSFLH